jgi:hypothetical protein
LIAFHAIVATGSCSARRTRPCAKSRRSRIRCGSVDAESHDGFALGEFADPVVDALGIAPDRAPSIMSCARVE